jgi:putrescine aminotransferase
MSGLWCVNVGYGQQALVDAATRQMQELPFYNASSRPPRRRPSNWPSCWPR